MKSYAVVIRTVNGGPKYARLLNSLHHQTISPRAIFVVLPDGFQPPKEKLGTETYLYTRKGMWNQRIYGLEYAFKVASEVEYLLVCDDDIEFGIDFVEKLMDMSNDNNIDILIPFLPQYTAPYRVLMDSITGTNLRNKSSKYHIKICSTAGYSINNSIRDNLKLTQSGSFACFMCKTAIVPYLSLKDELWLDATRYALPDDQVFFYKAYIGGFKLCTCVKPNYIHLDGHAGSDGERKKQMAYSSGRNYYIFWHRFLYVPQRKKNNRIWLRLAISYRIIIFSILFGGYSILQLDLGYVASYIRGTLNGYHFVKSKEYRNLPKL